MSTITIQYYAMLRDERGLPSETLETEARTVAQLYQTLAPQHRFTLTQNQLKVAVNDAFVDWDAGFQTNDTIVFIPPVAGG